MPTTPCSWADLHEGDIVYIDNYENGTYPKADPHISGPYRVKHVGNRVLETLGRRFNVPFMHYPNNLLRED